MKFIEYWLGLHLPYSSPFIRIKLGDFPFDLIKLLNADQCVLSNLTLVVGVQVEEFPARMCHATCFSHAFSDQGFIAGAMLCTT